MANYYNKILIPYDGSKPSDNALSHAIRIANMGRISSTENSNVQVILMHVIQEIPIPASFGITGYTNLISSITGDKITLREHIKELYQEMKSDATKMLDEKVKKYQNVKGKGEKVIIRTKVMIGSATDKIIEVANKEKVDLIIMGTTGIGGFAKIVLGSVARNVSEKAKCPVMLVR
jgi:nucleotide-binding universal stress UspA family protein